MVGRLVRQMFHRPRVIWSVQLWAALLKKIISGASPLINIPYIQILHSGTGARGKPMHPADTHIK